jgi:uncharacterized protein YbbC (DUF1343 family)
MLRAALVVLALAAAACGSVRTPEPAEPTRLEPSRDPEPAAPSPPATPTATEPAHAPAAPAAATASLPELDAVIAAAIDARKLPGAVVAIGSHTQLHLLHAYGDRAQLPARESMTVDTLFDLASLTKPVVTATLTMLLVERKQLSLDDNASAYLPELRDRYPDVTVRHLLTHAAGLPSQDSLGPYTQGRALTVSHWASLPRTAAPGTRFGYGDIAFLLLGTLIERVTGERLDVLAQREIFGPLRMHDTRFGPILDESRPRVAPTELADNVRKRIDPSAREHSMIRGTVHDPRAFRLGGVAGNAGLFSSAPDLVRYAQMLLSGGALDSARILEAATVASMTTPVFIGDSVRGLGWDMRTKYSGLRGHELTHRAFGHGGFTGVSLWVDPSLDLFVLVLSNRVHPSGDGYVIDLAGTIADIAARHFGRAPEPTQCAALLGRVQPGIDVLRSDGFAALEGKHVALIANGASRARDGTPTRELLANAPNVSLVALFAPEHGLDNSREGRIADGVDAHTGIPVFSLFGPTRKPTARMLQGVDTIVFDLQDVGVRFFTYMSTLRQVLEAAAEHDVRVVVLDRPNPLDAFRVEGPVLDPDRETFVNYHPLPTRHGMTAGELAQMVNAERRIGANLHVVRMHGYARELTYEETDVPWHAPSPNLATLQAVQLYPATGLLESANLSVGRGTDMPFAMVGAPWLRASEAAQQLRLAQLRGIEWGTAEITPAGDRYAGIPLPSLTARLTDPRAFRAVHAGLSVASTLRSLHPRELEADKLGRLLGSQRALMALLAGKTATDIERDAEADLMRFEARRAPFLLYPRCHAVH